MSSFRLVKLTDPINLVNIIGGLVPKGAYNNATDYAVGDSVSYNGYSYLMYVDAPAGTLPTDTTKWQLLGAGGDKTYVQSFTAVATVNVPHNLGKKPTIHIEDTAGDECEGEVHHTDENNLTLTFSSAFSGMVICN